MGVRFVVTGGLGGVGRAIVDRLAEVGYVVIIDTGSAVDCRAHAHPSREARLMRMSQLVLLAELQVWGSLSGG